MKKLIAVLAILMIASTAQAQTRRLRSSTAVDGTDSAVIKSTPGVFYGLSGYATAASGKITISDGSNLQDGAEDAGVADTQDIIFSMSVNANKDPLVFFAPNGIECGDTGIMADADTGVYCIIYYE